MVSHRRVDECWEGVLREPLREERPVANGAGVGHGEQAQVPIVTTECHSSLGLSDKLVIRQRQTRMGLIAGLVQVARECVVK